MKLKPVQILVFLLFALLVTNPQGIPGQQSSPVLISHEMLGTYENHYPFLIEREEDFQLYGLPGSGTSDDPYVIEGYNITSVTNAITITHVEVNFVIRNCYLSGDWPYALVNVEFANHFTIENCIISGGYMGIRIDNSYDFSIINNSIVDCGQGISTSSTNSSTINHNTVYSCTNGMELSIGVSSIEYNRIYGHSLSGIILNTHSIYNNLSNNQIGWNGAFYGLGGEKNARDYGTHNRWDMNSWSDYSGEGTYDVEGSANSVDLSPSVLSDSEKPISYQPENRTITVGETGHRILWNISDEFPYRYIFTADNRNSTRDGKWFGYPMITILDGLPVGSYNLTLNATDICGHSTLIICQITIVEPLITEDILRTLAVIGVIAIIIVGFEFSRRRKHQ